MKKIFFIALVLSGLLAGVGLRFDLAHRVPQFISLRLEANAAEHYRAATHIIHQESLNADKGCSATAIGPHALLTASHCEAPTDAIDIDGVTGYTISKIYRDGNDHSIYLVPGVTFPQVAKVAPRALYPGEFIFVWGNPVNTSDAQFVAVLRTGKYTASYLFKGRIVDVFDFRAIAGDSGSAVFTQNGDVVGVLSFSGDIALPITDRTFAGAGAIKLNFSKEVLQRAAQF